MAFDMGQMATENPCPRQTLAARLVWAWVEPVLWRLPVIRMAGPSHGWALIGYAHRVVAPGPGVGGVTDGALGGGGGGVRGPLRTNVDGDAGVRPLILGRGRRSRPPTLCPMRNSVLSGADRGRTTSKSIAGHPPPPQPPSMWCHYSAAQTHAPLYHCARPMGAPQTLLIPHPRMPSMCIQISSHSLIQAIEFTAVPPPPLAPRQNSELWL